MSENWPPLDLHAHVEATVAPHDLLALRAVVFAACRTLAESRQALDRQSSDLLTVWGVGVHPAVKEALESFDLAVFTSLIGRSAYVAEVGLDGKVKSRLPQQQEVLAEVLVALQANPRITSLHSYAATNELVELLQDIPIDGAVLHWWLGDAVATRRAVELGAYFSVNAGGLKHAEVLSLIPIERLLTETDHPAGDRTSPQPRQPGNVSKVEKGLASIHGIRPFEMRRLCWSNLHTLVASTGVARLLPPGVGSVVAAAG